MVDPAVESPIADAPLSAHLATAVEWNVTLLGTARIVEVPDRVREVSRRIDATYRGEDAGDAGGPMIEIEIGSATARRC